MYQAEPEREAEHKPRLLTIDFMGIGSHKEINSSTSSANCHHQLTNSRRSMQSCLRQIKPHMLHHLLFSNPEAEISEAITTLELFPQHTPQFQSNCKESDQQAGNGNGNGNGLQQIYADSEKGVSSTIAGAGEGAGLPLAKKLSLQRFLQKRKDRLNKLHPYTT